MHASRTSHSDYHALTEGQCREIHRASLEVLRRTGVRVMHEEAAAAPEAGRRRGAARQRGPLS